MEEDDREAECVETEEVGTKQLKRSREHDEDVEMRTKFHRRGGSSAAGESPPPPKSSNNNIEDLKAAMVEPPSAILAALPEHFANAVASPSHGMETA